MSGVTNNCAVASTIIESGREDDNDRDTAIYTPIYSRPRHGSTFIDVKEQKEKERKRERESVNRRWRIEPPGEES